jgi:hypothetical protein
MSKELADIFLQQKHIQKVFINWSTSLDAFKTEECKKIDPKMHLVGCVVLSQGAQIWFSVIRVTFCIAAPLSETFLGIFNSNNNIFHLFAGLAQQSKLDLERVTWEEDQLVLERWREDQLVLKLADWMGIQLITWLVSHLILELLIWLAVYLVLKLVT